MVEQPPNLNGKIEILSINDKDPNEDDKVQVVPNERMVVNEVIQIWKLQPATESLGIGKLHAVVKETQKNWSLSEKRLKMLLKKYNLLANQPKFCYVGQITSKATPGLDLPNKIKLQTTKNRGKGLYAAYNISKGTLLWEEKPFIFVPPLDHVYLMKIGKACSYCGKLLNSRTFDSQSFLNGLDCSYCEELWCSKYCKKADSLHTTLNHNEHSRSNLNVNSKAWKEYKEFCLENHWNAAFAAGLIHATECMDTLGKIAQQWDSFAKIRQDVRYKALDSSAGAFDSSNGGDGALFVKEQQELLWKQGHELFNEVFSDPEHKLSYEEYMTYLGTYNINNIDSLYLIQSHLNHNCDKNVDVRVENSKRLCDGIKVYADKDLKANEELVTSYVNPNHNVNLRKRELRVNWGFNCSCNRCKSEEKETHRLQSSIGAAASNATEEENPEELLSPEPLQNSRRRKSSIKANDSVDSRKAIQELLAGAKGEGEFEIMNANEMIGGRRKSVRFDEKVVAVNEQ